MGENIPYNILPNIQTSDLYQPAAFCVSLWCVFIFLNVMMMIVWKKKHLQLCEL